MIIKKQLTNHWSTWIRYCRWSCYDYGQMFCSIHCWRVLRLSVSLSSYKWSKYFEMKLLTSFLRIISGMASISILLIFTNRTLCFLRIYIALLVSIYREQWRKCQGFYFHVQFMLFIFICLFYYLFIYLFYLYLLFY